MYLNVDNEFCYNANLTVKVDDEINFLQPNANPSVSSLPESVCVKNMSKALKICSSLANYLSIGSTNQQTKLVTTSLTLI